MIERFRNYLLGAEVDVYTENRGITFGKRGKLCAIEQKLMAEMSMFNYTIKHELPDEEDVSPICDVSATPELGLLNSVVRESKSVSY